MRGCLQVEVISQTGSDGAGGPRVRVVVAEGRKHEVRCMGAADGTRGTCVGWNEVHPATRPPGR